MKKKNKSIDFFIRSKSQSKVSATTIGLEIVAHESNNQVLEHINRAYEYQERLNADIVYVLNFTNVRQPSVWVDNTVNSKSKKINVQIIHIFHDWNSKKAIISFQDENPVEIKLLN